MHASLPATALPLRHAGYFISKCPHDKTTSRTLVCLKYHLPRFLEARARPLLLAPCKPKLVRRLFKASRSIHNVGLDPDMLRNGYIRFV